MTKYVLACKFEELTGYTEKAVQRKIQSGVWREGREYRRAPDGHILVNLEGYERWVENQPPAGSPTTEAAARSSSTTKARDTAPLSP